MGDTDWNANLDMLNVIVIGITNELPEASEENDLHRFLTAIYSKNLDSREILDVLHREYDISITTELNEEVNEMCNLGEGIAERALAEGLEQGLERGRMEATAEYVVSLHNRGRSNPEIADTLDLDIERVAAILHERGMA